MGKTIRRDRDDKKHTEGRTKGFRTWKCDCGYCRNTERRSHREKMSKNDIQRGISEMIL